MPRIRCTREWEGSEVYCLFWGNKRIEIRGGTGNALSYSSHKASTASENSLISSHAIFDMSTACEQPSNHTAMRGRSNLEMGRKKDGLFTFMCYLGSEIFQVHRCMARQCFIRPNVFPRPGETSSDLVVCTPNLAKLRHTWWGVPQTWQNFTRPGERLAEFPLSWRASGQSPPDRHQAWEVCQISDFL